MKLRAKKIREDLTMNFCSIKKRCFLPAIFLCFYFSGCGGDLEHVPNPFEEAEGSAGTEKIVVIGAGVSGINSETTGGLLVPLKPVTLDEYELFDGAAALKSEDPIEIPFAGMHALAVGGFVYTNNPEQGTLTVFFTATGALEGIVRVGSSPGALLFDPTQQFLFVLNQGGIGDSRKDSISIVDVNPTTTTFLQAITRVAVEDDPYDIALSTQRNRAFVSNRRSGTVSVIDLDSSNLDTFLSVTQSIELGPSPGQLEYSPISGHLYVVLNFPTAADSIAILDADAPGNAEVLSGIPRGIDSDELSQVRFIRVSNDGSFLWVAFSDGIAAIDARTNSVLSKLTISEFLPNRIIEANNALLFVSGLEESGELLLIDASAPLALHEVSRVSLGLNSQIQNFVMNTDQTRVYVLNSLSKEKGSVSVIDVATRELLDTIQVDGLDPHTIVLVSSADLDVREGMDDLGDHGHDPGHHTP